MIRAVLLDSALEFFFFFLSLISDLLFHFPYLRRQYLFDVDINSLLIQLIDSFFDELFEHIDFLRHALRISVYILDFLFEIIVELSSQLICVLLYYDLEPVNWVSYKSAQIEDFIDLFWVNWVVFLLLPCGFFPRPCINFIRIGPVKPFDHLADFWGREILLDEVNEDFGLVGVTLDFELSLTLFIWLVFRFQMILVMFLICLFCFSAWLAIGGDVYLLPETLNEIAFYQGCVDGLVEFLTLAREIR